MYDLEILAKIRQAQIERELKELAPLNILKNAEKAEKTKTGLITRLAEKLIPKKKGNQIGRKNTLRNQQSES